MSGHLWPVEEHDILQLVSPKQPFIEHPFHVVKVAKLTDLKLKLFPFQPTV